MAVFTKAPPESSGTDSRFENLLSTQLTSKKVYLYLTQTSLHKPAVIFTFSLLNLKNISGIATFSNSITYIFNKSLNDGIFP